MARNIRNFGITSYEVDFAIVEDGQLKQKRIVTDTASPRKLVKRIAREFGVDPSKVVIVSTTEATQNYRINDMVTAIELLVQHGLAEAVTEAEAEAE